MNGMFTAGNIITFQ